MSVSCCFLALLLGAYSFDLSVHVHSEWRYYMIEHCSWPA